MFRNSKLLFWTCEILLLTVIFYIWKSMGTLISPFVSVLNTILLPFLIAGFLYYITNPIVELLEKHLKIKRVFGILITLVLLFGIIGLGIFYLLPILINQLTSLINSTQGLYWEVKVWFENFRPILCSRMWISSRRFSSWISLIWISYKISWIVWPTV